MGTEQTVYAFMVAASVTLGIKAKDARKKRFALMNAVVMVFAPQVSVCAHRAIPATIV